MIQRHCLTVSAPSNYGRAPQQVQREEDPQDEDVKQEDRIERDKPGRKKRRGRERGKRRVDTGGDVIMKDKLKCTFIDPL